MQATNFAPLRRWLGQHTLWWQRLTIITAVLLFSLFLAARLPLRLSLLLMALPVLLVGAAIILRWPPLGLALLIVVSLGFRTELIYVIGTTAVTTFALTALWLFDSFVIKRRFHWIAARPLNPLLLFLVVTIIAFINGQLPWYPARQAPLEAQLGGILILLVAMCAFLLVMYQVKSERWLMVLVYVTIGLGAVLIFGRIFPPTSRFVLRFFSPLVFSGSMFWLWVVALSFSQALFNQTLQRHWRILLFSVTLGAMYIALGEARSWVSGWFPALLAMLLIVWLGMPRQAIALTVVGVLGVLLQLQNVVNNLLYVGDNEYSQITRLEAWRIIAEIVRVSPLLGLGPANYSFYTPLFPILGWYVQFNSHNQYVDVVAQTGILGLLCLLWFFAEIIWLAWRLRPLLPRGSFLQAYVYGTLAGVVATFAAGMLGDWLLPYVYNATIRAMRTSILPWLFMGGLVAVAQILRAGDKGPIANPQAWPDQSATSSTSGR